MLLFCYVLTLAPGVTFWDAGEFITAAWGLGIPHPPGTPLYVALGHAWMLSLAPLFGAVASLNLLSAVATAGAGAVMAWLMASEPTRGHASVREQEFDSWRSVTALLCAGLMASVWSNATETEVYAVALLHGVLLLACAAKAGGDEGVRGRRWMLLTAYLMLLAPAVHLSVLVAAPAAIALASRDDGGRWNLQRVAQLAGVLVISAGIGRMSIALVVVGATLAALSPVTTWRRNNRDERNPTARGAGRALLAILLLSGMAASALLMLMIRARHDPALNQGNPSTFRSLADVVARRQYDVAPMWPRRAPWWLQLANVVQYLDWQVALGWGRGVFTTPARVLAMLVFAVLAIAGARSLRRDVPRLADALLVLLASGTIGVAVYLNMRPGASLGWGVLPDSVVHEARERDYFFVYGFWAWGCLAGCGAAALVRARRWPSAAALVVALLPLVGNWRVSDRRHTTHAHAAERVAHALLDSAPRDAVLFLAGDNDSYPVWYAQQVEHARPDVTPVTLPLLSARWYTEELARRTSLRWNEGEHVAGLDWRHEQQAALVARAARAAGRPVAASPLLSVGERALLGSGWRLTGVLYLASDEAGAKHGAAVVDTLAARRWISLAPLQPTGSTDVDDAPRIMLGLLDCPRLAQSQELPVPRRDSLEVSCNFR